MKVHSSLTLPYPPSVNAYWRIFTPPPPKNPKKKRAHARIILSEEGRDYKKLAAEVCMTSGIRPLDGPVAIEIDVYRPIRAGDLDGRIKAVLDALNGVAYHDDKQICEIHARRFDSNKERARVEVRIGISELVETQAVLMPDLQAPPTPTRTATPPLPPRCAYCNRVTSDHPVMSPVGLGAICSTFTAPRGNAKPAKPRTFGGRKPIARVDPSNYPESVDESW